MALPVNVNFGTVTGTFIDATGTNITGNVTFTPSATSLKDASALQTIIQSQPVKVPLQNGSFSVQLIATDDTDVSPTGWTYGVAFDFGLPSFSISVPQGQTVDLTTVAPTTASNGQPTYTGALSTVGIGTAPHQIDGFWTGTQAEYTAISVKDAATLYLITA
jgi:hypothetical protein